MEYVPINLKVGGGFSEQVVTVQKVGDINRLQNKGSSLDRPG